MVSLDNSRIATYEKDGKKFEILVEPDIALDVKEGKKDIRHVLSDMLAFEAVYKDAGKFDKHTEKTVFEAFGTHDMAVISKIILTEGRIDLTTDQKRRITESKRKEIIDYIVRNSINPVLKAPHTPQRVEGALDQIRVDIDINKPISAQVDKIIEKLRVVLPMTFQTSKFVIKVPVSYVGKVQHILSKYDVLERKWEGEYFLCIINVPIGLKDNLIKTVDGLTHGSANIELIS